MTAGTIFDKTRTPLRVWLAAAWYVTNQKLGVSALGLQRVLGLGSYETAWTMLHRFRRAMVRPERELLKGEVEVDETYLAISDRDEPLSSARAARTRRTRCSWPSPWRSSSPRASVGSGLRRIDNDSDAFVVPFVQDNIEPGAQVRTDGSAAYRSLSQLGFEHNRQVMLGAESAGPCHDARRAPGGLPGQALDPGHASWLGPARAPRRLPRRVRLPLQPAYFELARHVVLPADAAGRRDRTGDVPERRRGLVFIAFERVACTGWISSYLAHGGAKWIPLINIQLFDKWPRAPLPRRRVRLRGRRAAARAGNAASGALARPPARPQRARPCASGFAALDAELPGGGWPRRVLSELLLPHPGVGEIRLLAPALVAVAAEPPGGW